MKQNYVSPSLETLSVSQNSMLASSDKMEDNGSGFSMEDPAPLKRLNPLIVNFDELEPDIQENLKEQQYACNFRTVNLMGMDYLFIVGTFKGDDNVCICFYAQMLYSDSFLMYYNIYEFLETFLMQIRHKINGVYEYKITKEVRKKMPTFCKLMENAKLNDKKPTFGLPFITFLDSERKYTLLSAGFKCNDNIDDNTSDKIHSSFCKILGQLIKESNEAGILDQSVNQLARNGLRLLLFARHFFAMP